MSFEFALKGIEYCEELENHKKFVVSHQLLKAGTSIGANLREAQNAESEADFFHKLKIAAKEADETRYWLQLCERAITYPRPDALLSEIDSIIKLLNSIITTLRRKHQPK